MTDLPILFSGPMVRALLGGTKTQTRRTANPQPPKECSINYMLGNESWLPTEQRSPARRSFEAWGGDLFHRKPEKALCGLFEIVPRYQPGDRLYVREHWQAEASYDDVPPRDIPFDACMVRYEADGAWSDCDAMTYAGRFRQGMHMPRWASRITLTVTDVRVQRLYDISDADCLAEGIQQFGRFYGWQADDDWDEARTSPRVAYFDLLNSLHGDGFAASNPWLSAYSFTVERGNIDQLAVQ